MIQIIHPAILPTRGTLLQLWQGLPREWGEFSVAGICKCLRHSNKAEVLPCVVNRFYQSICAQIPP